MDLVPFKHRDTLIARIRKFLSHDHFEGICLASSLHPKKCRIHRIFHVQTDDSVTYDEAVKLPFQEVNVGMAFGPLWSKHWFRLDIQIPSDWEGEEVCLKWNAESECQVWVDDAPVQGLSSKQERLYYTITNCTTSDKLNHTIYIEMSINGLYNDFNEAPPDFCATLTTAEIMVFDRDVFRLIMDLQVLYELATDLPEDSTRSDEVLHVANDVISSCVLGDKESYERARNIASKVLSQKNGDGGHLIQAVGYANIDTAWLWPYRKTPMKCVSSWSVVFNLMEKYPLKLAFTQPQQLVWVREKYPEFYRRVEHHIATGQLIPVGATWLEMDANLPNGESLIRQFLYGQKFYMDEFKIKCTDLWILDSFGYPAQLPQIMRHCDVTRFVSIKLSWNSVNKFPHSTFWWKGLGGYKVLTHFPPGTNYHKTVTVKELLEVERVFSDTGRSNTSLFLYGHGNAGLGPTEEMLEKLQRMEDLNGLPRVKLSTPEEFYQTVECDPGRLCTWDGELYLERHQGTYTSQAMVKKRNRRVEFLLRDTDLWTSVAAVQTSSNQKPYIHPGTELQRIWKLLMISQFHDVLPGSAHPEVYKDFHTHLDDIEEVAESLRKQALLCIVADKKTKQNTPWSQTEYHVDTGANIPQKKSRSMFNDNLNHLGTDGDERQMYFDDTMEFHHGMGLRDRRMLPLAIRFSFFLGVHDTSGCGFFANTTNSLTQDKNNARNDSVAVVNSLSWQRKEVVTLQDTATEKHQWSELTQTDRSDSSNRFALVQTTSCGLSCLQLFRIKYPAFAIEKDDHLHISNHLLSATIDKQGRLVELRKPGSEKNYLSKGRHGNQFVMYDDYPLYRDAWDSLDYHLQTRRVVGEVVRPAAVVESGPIRAVVQVCLKISATSEIRQSIILDTECPYLRFHTEVSWEESHKFLKVEFPTSISSTEATYEIQFGHLQRPTHYNTSWDSAKYEVCGHKWAALWEHGRGVAVLNDCKYGKSCVGDTMRLSLLRSPTAPDPQCDIGNHEFTYALMPFTGTFQEAGVIQQAYNLNCPVSLQTGTTTSVPTDGISYFWLDTDQVILETVKIAEDNPKAMILRLYEAFGGSTSARLMTSLPVQDVSRCNGLEEEQDSPDDEPISFHLGQPTVIQMNLGAFQIVSLLVRF